MQELGHLNPGDLSEILEVEFSAVNVSWGSNYVPLDNIFGYLVLLLLLKFLVVLHHKQLAFGARVEIDNFFHLFLHTTDFFVFEQHVKLHRTTSL